MGGMGGGMGGGKGRGGMGAMPGAGGCRGLVKLFHVDMGWGFISYQGVDLFVHIKDCIGGQPQVGDQVTFEIRDVPSKLFVDATRQACNVIVSASGIGRRDPAAHPCENLASFISEQGPTFDLTTVAIFLTIKVLLIRSNRARRSQASSSYPQHSFSYSWALHQNQ